jgi:predicted PurR-regulated permease PerM
MENFRPFAFLAKNFFKIAFIVVICVAMFKIFLPFAVILIVAFLSSLALEPFILRLENRTKLSRGWVTTLVLFVGIFLVILPFTLFCLQGSNWVVNKLIPYLSAQNGGDYQDYLAPLKEGLQRMGGLFNIDASWVNAKLTASLNSLLASVIEGAKNIASNIPDLLFSLGLFILSLAVFMMSLTECKSFIYRHSHMREENYEAFMRAIAQSARLIFVSNIVTGVVQAVIVAGGAFLCGFHEFFLIFFITFVSSFVPVVGTAPVLIVLIAAGFMSGSVGSGIGMIVVALITAVSDNLCRSLTLTAGETGLPAFVGFLSVIGGMAVFGFSGLLLGPLVTSICFYCLPILIDDLMERDSHEE